jgi:hypothetical protein
VPGLAFGFGLIEMADYRFTDPPTLTAIRPPPIVVVISSMQLPSSANASLGKSCLYQALCITCQHWIEC